LSFPRSRLFFWAFLFCKPLYPPGIWDFSAGFLPLPRAGDFGEIPCPTYTLSERIKSGLKHRICRGLNPMWGEGRRKREREGGS